MTDFFREVDEEVRRDRALKLFQKYRIPLIAVLALIIAGTAAWRIYDAWRVSRAQGAGAAYEAAEQLDAEGKTVQAQAAFQKLVSSGPQGYALLARFRVAATTAKTDPAAAVKNYDALAADSGVDPMLRDVARYRAAALRLDAADPKEMDQRLAPLTRSGNPFRNSARELLALSALKTNDFAAAGNWLDMIMADPLASTDQRQRAEALLGIVAANRPAAKASKPAPNIPGQPLPNMASQPAPK